MFLFIIEKIGDAILNAIRTLFLILCEIVCKFIVFFFNIFERFGTATILDDSTITTIYQKIGLLLGLFMIFRLSFSFIQYVINPDNMTDKKNGVGNIVKKIIIVVVLFGTTPYLFKEAYRIQSFLIEQNVVGKIFMNDNSVSKGDFGVELAWYSFSSFYNYSTYASGNKINNCPDKYVIYDEFSESHSLRFAYDCLNETDDLFIDGEVKEDYIVDFDGYGIVPLIVCVLILWMIIIYTIQLGVRLLQLAYLQLIAPIPIFMYLDPNGSDKLVKWSKQCLTTFLDYFIRTAIMYFVIFIVRLLVINDESVFMKSFNDLNLVEMSYVNIVVIIALLIFAKRVPKLLEEVFPMLKNAASLDFGLKMPKEMKQVGGVVAGAGLGVVGAGVSGISRYKSNMAAGKSTGKALLGGAYGVGAGLITGVRSGFTKKGVSGGWKNIQESNNKYNKLVTSGGTTMGTIKAKVGDTLGESEGQKFTRIMANYQTVIDDNKYVNDVAENFSEIKKLKTRWETLRMSGSATEDDINDAFDTYKNAKKAALTAALNNKNDFEYKIVKTHGGMKFETDETGSLSGYEDKAFAGQIQVRANATEDFVNSHNVELLDEHGNKITKFNSARAFKDASVSASNSQTEILKNNDFGAAIANDAAAGVDSHKTEQKDKKGGH